jgi:LytS/YehU family sensor histidine kinase
MRKYVYCLSRWHQSIAGVVIEAPNMKAALESLLATRDLADEPDGVFGGPYISLTIAIVPEDTQTEWIDR